MPELPEVESARAVIDRNGLRRRIADVDDSDTFVCRPHVPGEIRHALLGSELSTEIDGGDYWEGGRQLGDYRWARFTVIFDDGGR
jgi:formamidopyrimidine-DNA glycosylase